MFTNDKYKVVLSEYAKKHFLFKKYSKKKLKSVFEKPKKSLFLLLEKFDLALNRELAEVITFKDNDLVICKIEFKIYPQDSPKTSGNRCIVLQDKINKKIEILFAYDKNDVGGGSETVWWKKKIKENFSEHSDIIGKI